MQWFVTNWFWILIGIAFIGMHLYGHGRDAGFRADLLRPDLDVDPPDDTESNARTSPGDHRP
ncbi:MAG: DUF2933 domain-containing protein [Gemmatimonadaceae bacterium]